MEPFLHAIIPAIILLALYPKLKLKYILLLLPIVWFLDIEYITNYHRFLFHNIFFVLLIAEVMYFAWNKKAFWISLYYGLSHLILDSGFPGNALFYPLNETTYYITASITRTSHWIVNFSINTLTRAEFLANQQSLEYITYISEIPILILILMVVILTIKLISSRDP
ncbi:MAG: hypothetical protein Q8Q35_04195 [Nanoarchaeota archaeon]|nr:hypothetical protein [Nanoarchaeota archaeon]